MCPGGTGGMGGMGGTGGTGGTGGMGGTGGTGGDEMFPPGQFKRGTQVVVNPGQSIQEAIDRARPGTRRASSGRCRRPSARCSSCNSASATRSGSMAAAPN